VAEFLRVAIEAHRRVRAAAEPINGQGAPLDGLAGVANRFANDVEAHVLTAILARDPRADVVAGSDPARVPCLRWPHRGVIYGGTLYMAIEHDRDEPNVPVGEGWPKEPGRHAMRLVEVPLANVETLDAIGGGR